MQDPSDETSNEKEDFVKETSYLFQRNYLLNYIHYFMGKVHFTNASKLGAPGLNQLTDPFIDNGGTSSE